MRAVYGCILELFYDYALVSSDSRISSRAESTCLTSSVGEASAGSCQVSCEVGDMGLKAYNVIGILLRVKSGNGTCNGGG